MPQIVRRGTQLQRTFARFDRKLAAMTPAMRKAWLDGFVRLQKMVPEATVARLLATGGIERLMSQGYSANTINIAFGELRRQMRSSVESATVYFGKELPRRAQTASIAFGYLSPQVTRAVARLQTQVMTDLTASLQTVVRRTVAQGLRDGLGARAIARRLPASLPLSPTQQGAIENFRVLLVVDPKQALTRALRSKKFDAAVERAIAGEALPRATVERMVAAYAKNMAAFNAETIARTATLDSLKQGQWSAYKNAIDEGLLDDGVLFKQWKTVGDNRVRDEHIAMEGEIAPADLPYSNGEMVPGESTYNCRCISLFFMRQLRKAI